MLLFRDGLVLFSAEAYSLSDDALRSQHVHLTNAAIGKRKARNMSSPREHDLEAEHDNGGDDAKSWLTCVPEIVCR